MQPAKNTRLSLVRPCKALKTFQHTCTSEYELESAVRQLGNIETLIHSPELLIHICSLVEAITKVKLDGAAKKALVVKTVAKFFPTLNNSTDLDRLSQMIDFFCTSKLITKISTSQVISRGLCSFVLKKLI